MNRYLGRKFEDRYRQEERREERRGDSRGEGREREGEREREVEKVSGRNSGKTDRGCGKRKIEGNSERGNEDSRNEERHDLKTGQDSVA